MASTTVRSIATIAGGTAIAQLITLALTPVVTRLFSPEAYGALGTFSSILAILAPVAALSYPMAIVLSRDEADAYVVARLSALSCTTFAALALAVASCFESLLIERLGLPSIPGLALLLALGIFFTGLAQTLRYGALRNEAFSSLAKVEISSSILNNSLKAGLGAFFPFPATLLAIYTTNQALQAFFLRRALLVQKAAYESANQTQRTIFKTAREFKEFPLFRAPQGFLNAATQTLPIFLLGAAFGQATVGHYTLALSMLSAPIALVGKAVGEVFYPKFARAVAGKESIDSSLIRATLVLAMISSPLFGMICAFGPEIFSLVFGDQWRAAGEFSRWLAVWLFFSFINRPAVAAIAPLGAQRFLLLFELSSLLLRSAVLLIGTALIRDDVISIALFSCTGAALNLYLIITSIVRARRISQSA